MSKKTHISHKDKGIKTQYANVLSVIIQLLQPKFLFIVAGRGAAKTTAILSQRLYKVAYEMPGCYVALVADTYMNALKNVVPSLIEGFDRMGWIEDIHYVVGKRPPAHFKKPYKPPHNWKHTITIHTGCHVKIISMDRPSTGAGDSYQHIIGDEVKYIPEKKINKLTPAIRGEYVRFCNSPLYRGRTFTTDMPNPNHREHEWIKDMKKNMDNEQIRLMFETALVVNEIRKELYHAKKENNKKEIKLVTKKLNRWIAAFNTVRKDSTFYYEASSYVNVDILTLEFFKDLIDTMDFREMKTSVLSIEPKLEKGQKFYPNMESKNYYTDSYNYGYYDHISIERSGIKENSLGLKHILHDAPLDIGLDTGKMCSLPIGQLDEQHNRYRILKNLFTITPEFLPELGEKFRSFFEFHNNKTVYAYCDRAANNLKDVGEDHASKFQRAIEYDSNGNRTDWTCQIMTRDQGNITQQTEYELMLKMANGDYGLPKLLIDANEAKELKSSIEKAKLIVKENKEGEKTLHKDKSSEGLPDERLPLESTNMSDGMKYLLCRPSNLEKLKGKTIRFTSSPSMH